MGWFRLRLSEDEQQVLLDHRDCHVDRIVRQRMWVLWLLHCGETREKTAEILQLSRATVQRYVASYRTEGLAGLVSRGAGATTSPLAAFDDTLRAEFRERPARSVAEAGERIQSLTGLVRRPSQVRYHLHRLGLEYRRMRAIPAPPKKSWRSTSPTRRPSSKANCNRHSTPPSRAAAMCSSWMPSHFVMGTFLCCLWCFARVFVKAAAGRQRLNVLGAWNAVTQELVSVINTATVNADTMCELLRKIATLGLTGPITLVLDNAKYQHAAAVKALAQELGIHLEFLPGYSPNPNLNLIERLWKFLKRRALYGRYHPDFASFRSAIETEIEQLTTTHKSAIASLMTLNFQTFKNVSLLAA